MSDTKIERTSLFSDVDLQQSKQPWTPFCEGGSFICETCIGSCGVEEFAERKEAYLRSGHKREPLWKQELRNRLAMSVQARASGGSPSRLALNYPIPNASGGPIYEDFVFIRGLEDSEVAAFVEAAQAAISSSDTEEAWDRFLEPYWAALTLPRRPAPAVVDPFAGDDGFIDEAELDELIRPAGAMVSRRFPRVS